MKLEHLGLDRFVLRAGYSNALREVCRQVPGVKFDHALKGFVGWGDCLETVLGEVKGKVQEQLLNPDLLAQGVVGQREFAPKNLRKYQVEGVHFLLEKRAAILADDMGLGKSAQALTAARVLGLKTVIVCFKYAKGVWGGPGGEISKWWPRTKVDSLEGSKLHRLDPSTDVALIHYDVLHHWVLELTQWGAQVLIVDEAQAIAGEDSRRAKAIRALALECPYRFFLTGTPMPNRPRDLWNILDTLHPGRWGNFYAFGMRYCGGHKVEIPEIGKTVYDFNGVSHPEELASRLKWVMLRRAKQDVALELPPKTRQVVWLEAGKGARTWKESLSRKTIREILNKTTDAKIEQGIELVAGHASRGRVVVACYRRVVAEWVAESLRSRGIDTELVMGGLSADRRKKYIDRARVAATGALVVTIDSCATSVDFSWASVGVVLELTYEPAELMQFESRLDRFGQKNPVLIQYICARGGVDELVIGAVLGKLENFEKVLTAQNEGAKMRSDLGGMPSGEDILREIGL